MGWWLMSTAGDLITGETFDASPNGSTDSDDTPSREDANGSIDSFDDNAPPVAVAVGSENSFKAFVFVLVWGYTNLEPGAAGQAEDRRGIDGAAPALRKPFCSRLVGSLLTAGWKE